MKDNKSKKNLRILTALFIIIGFILCGVGGFLLGQNTRNNSKIEDKTELKDKVEKNDNIEEKESTHSLESSLINLTMNVELASVVDKQDVSTANAYTYYTENGIKELNYYYRNGSEYNLDINNTVPLSVFNFTDVEYGNWMEVSRSDDTIEIAREYNLKNDKSNDSKYKYKMNVTFKKEENKWKIDSFANGVSDLTDDTLKSKLVEISLLNNKDYTIPNGNISTISNSDVANIIFSYAEAKNLTTIVKGEDYTKCGSENTKCLALEENDIKDIAKLYNFDSIDENEYIEKSGKMYIYIIYLYDTNKTYNNDLDINHSLEFKTFEKGVKLIDKRIYYRGNETVRLETIVYTFKKEVNGDYHLEYTSFQYN
ncbi:MAG: hypothetical protein IJ568_07415 [Bacilli bacterium]|nr:hypothetical protein [Bacilli bacterium]